MSNAAPAQRNIRRIQSIEVGFRLIRALEGADGHLPLKDVAALAGMPASKAYLYLYSFVREGLVQQDPGTGHYGLGPYAVQLGLAAVRQLDVLQLGRGELDGLRRDTGCAAYLSIWGNRGPVIAAKVDGARQGSMAVRLGFVLPLLHTATGRLFLAHLPDNETAPLLEAERRERPDAEAVSSAELAEVLDGVRREGYASSAVSRHPLNAGFAAMAAPVFDHSGAIAAALTLLGPAELMGPPKQRGAHVRLMIAAAARLSARMGLTPVIATAEPVETRRRARGR